MCADVHPVWVLGLRIDPLCLLAGCRRSGLCCYCLGHFDNVYDDDDDEAYLSGQLASFSAFTLLVGSSDLKNQLLWKGIEFSQIECQITKYSMCYQHHLL